MHTKTPIQMLSLAETCKLLCKSRSGLYKLMASDSSFPRPIKDGTARQARVVFVSTELAAWQESKLASRLPIVSSGLDTSHQTKASTEITAVLRYGDL